LKDDYVFTKEDISEIVNNGTAMEKNAKGQISSVTKYTLKLKDGKTAICSIDQNGALRGNFESRIY
jgi:hypothetical protein